MRLTTLILAALALAIMAPQAMAQPGNGQGRRGDRDKITPEKVAQVMMERHDENGDGMLSLDELTAALKARFEHRQENGPGGPGMGIGRPGQGQRPGMGAGGPGQGQGRGRRGPQGQ